MASNNNKRQVKKKIILESILVFFVAITPFLFKVYDYLPDGDPEATISFLGITIDSNGFNNVSAYIWFLTGKIIPLYLLVFWFLTSKDWWYHILLIPICMYAFQLFELVFSEDDNIDAENIFWLLPICMAIIPFVYFIRVKLYDKYVHGIDLEAMDAELKVLREKERLSQEKTQNNGSTGTPGDMFIEDEDLTEKTPNKVLNQLAKQFRHFSKSFLNL